MKGAMPYMAGIALRKNAHSITETQKSGAPYASH